MYTIVGYFYYIMHSFLCDGNSNLQINNTCMIYGIYKRILIDMIINNKIKNIFNFVQSYIIIVKIIPFRTYKRVCKNPNKISYTKQTLMSRRNNIVTKTKPKAKLKAKPKGQRENVKIT